MLHRALQAQSEQGLSMRGYKASSQPISCAAAVWSCLGGDAEVQCSAVDLGLLCHPLHFPAGTGAAAAANAVCSPSTGSCFIWKPTSTRRDTQKLLLCLCIGWGMRVLGSDTEGAQDVSSDLVLAEVQQGAGLPVPCQHHGTGGCGFLLLPAPLVRQEVMGCPCPPA